MQWKRDECGYQTKTLKIIRRHRLRIHMGVDYPCDKCDYARAAKSFHVRINHKQIKFWCDILENSQKAPLKKHMISVFKNLNNVTSVHTLPLIKVI